MQKSKKKEKIQKFKKMKKMKKMSFFGGNREDDINQSVGLSGPLSS
jgi:hypothetical protein